MIIISCENYLININQNIHKDMTTPVSEKGVIGIGMNETIVT